MIKSGSNELRLEFSGNEMELKELIKQIFSDAEQKKATLDMFRDFYNLYERDSVELIDTLRREEGETGLSKSLRELLAELKGPFQRTYHTFYDITRTDTVDALMALGHEHQVSERIRQLQESKEGIFREIGIDADILFSSPTVISDGNAAVCEGSKYRGHNILFVNKINQGRTITVF